MLARPTLTKPVQDDASKPKTQTRPIEERFLLRVDGQIKRSFSSKDDAATAGAAIKKAYPIVVVTVVDTEEHTTEIINAWLIVTGPILFSRCDRPCAALPLADFTSFCFFDGARVRRHSPKFVGRRRAVFLSNGAEFRP